MSTLLDKSKMYKQAADNLQARKLFCPEAHCRYYSCLQWMLHIAESYSLLDHYSQRSLHLELIEKISASILTQTKNESQAFQFRKKINRLKAYRVRADYKEELLSEGEAKETRTLETSVKEILTEVYGTT